MGLNILGEGSENEFALRDANVWDIQPLVVYDLIIVQEDIQIDVAGSLVNYLVTAHRVFNVLKLI